ncbi:hypothetical protein HY634_02375 [Candidatus Uhrbacteria bacterium]|nr:hypothetical protein [Candidatus Uhrbacteria bacterium]
MHPAVKTIVTAAEKLRGLEGILRDHEIDIETGEPEHRWGDTYVDLNRGVRSGSYRLQVEFHCRVDDDDRCSVASLAIHVGDDPNDSAAISLDCSVGVDDSRWTFYIGETNIPGLTDELEREYGDYGQLTDAQVIAIANRIAAFFAQQLRAAKSPR